MFSGAQLTLAHKTRSPVRQDFSIYDEDVGLILDIFHGMSD